MPAGKIHGLNKKKRIRNEYWWVGWIAIPLVVYGIALLLLTGRWVFGWGDRLLATEGDAFQNLWSMHWVREAIFDGQDIYFTPLLFYPEGVSLVGHALNPLAGGVYVLMGQFLTVVQTYNLILLAGFILAGWGMYLVARRLAMEVVPALAAGLVYGFSAAHLAQARDHLEMASIFWLPLFLWAAVSVICDKKPAKGLIFLGAVVLLSWYTSPYWVVMQVASGLFLTVFLGKKFWSRPPRGKRLGLAVLMIALVLLIPVRRLILQQLTDPLVEGHTAELFSVDLAAFFVPDQYWRWHQLIDDYWSVQLDRQYEVSAFQGWSVLFLAGWGWRKSWREKRRGFVGMGVLTLAAAWWSLGPVIRFNAKPLGLPSVYALVERLMPAVGMSGVPGRMLFVVSLGMALLVAVGVRELLGRKNGGKWLILLGVLWVVEMKPVAMPSVGVMQPDYVRVLADLPHKGAVVDALSGSEKSLYFQTVHRQPLAWGYISREPVSAYRWKKKLVDHLQRRDWEAVCTDFDIGYVVTGTSFEADGERLVKVYDDEMARVWTLMCGED